MRLGRLQRALRALDGPERRPIAATALRAGYFDQAYLARDFHLFGGIPPARWLRETGEFTRRFIADLDQGARVDRLFPNRFAPSRRHGEFFQNSHRGAR